MTADRETVKAVSALCGKLKSAWSLQVGFGTRLNGLLPEIVALPSDQIDACFEKAAKGDPGRRACLVPIACEHLFHPSLHHRIVAWLEDETLPFRDTVLTAIGRFRLRKFASCLDRFIPEYRYPSDRQNAEAHMTRSAAISAAALLKSPENLAALLSAFETATQGGKQGLMRSLLAFPAFDAKPWLQSWFRSAEVIDEIEICERYVAGSISQIEQMSLCHDAHLIWQLARWYGNYEKREVIEFLVRHLDFEQTWFSSQKMSQTIVCRGRVATEIIAELNGWHPPRHEMTKESGERMKSFMSSLWSALRADPALAFQTECPVRYTYPAKHKVHKQIEQLLGSHGKVWEDDPDLGYSLRQANEGDDLILAFHVPNRGHWRIVRLSDWDRQHLASGETQAQHLFFRYSSRGALVAFHDQILVNANDLENKDAKTAIRKKLRTEARKADKKAASKTGDSEELP